VNPPALAIAVRDASQVAEARRGAVAAAVQAGLNETDAGRAAIVATELATNLLKHGGGGEILMTCSHDEIDAGLELIALDRGAGMADVEACLRDGYSTAGSAGQGLGAVRRQSDVFDIFSRPGDGTAILCRLLVEKPPRHAKAHWPAWGGISLPAKGESECGDSWAIRRHGEDIVMLVADGLGHGPNAAAASRAAVAVFAQHYQLPLEDLAGRVHNALRATRGAAIALCRIERAGQAVRYVGIGNIAGTLLSAAGARKMVSHNGTAGMVARKIQQFNYQYSGTATVIMHSDGVGTSWSLEHYPGLVQRHPALLSAVLYRDFTRGRDDVSMIAATL
jgi:anti-sigma regulatory factor (Ser/Thr protein kinase)